MNKNKRYFLILLLVFQVILVYMGIGSYSENSSTIFINISLFIAIANILSFIVDILKKERELYKNVETDSYFRELDLKLEPLYAGVVTKTCKIGFNSIIIIIYELVEQQIFVRKYHHNKVYISLHPNITLEDINVLSKEKQIIIKTIFNGSNDKNEYEINEIISNIKSDINKSRNFKHIFDSLNKQAKKNYFSSYLWSIDDGLSTLVSFIVVIPLVSFIPFIFMAVANNMDTSSVITLILFIVNFLFYSYFICKDFPKKIYFDEIKKLNGLYNFLNDFSNIKSSEMKYVEIYDKYYLYALSFGLTDKVEKEYNFSSIDNNIMSNLKYLIYIEKSDKNG